MVSCAQTIAREYMLCVGQFGLLRTKALQHEFELLHFLAPAGDLRLVVGKHSREGQLLLLARQLPVHGLDLAREQLRVILHVRLLGNLRLGNPRAKPIVQEASKALRRSTAVLFPRANPFLQPSPREAGLRPGTPEQGMGGRCSSATDHEQREGAHRF